MSVDWAGLEHAYGSAGDTPGTLHRLATGDLREAATALGTLHSTIAHQGSVYSATLAAVPLLAPIAGDPATSVRAGTVLLLDTIASAPFYFVRAADWFVDPVAGRERLVAIGGHTELACHDAVREAVPDLLAGLATAPPDVAVALLALASGFVEEYDRLAPAVEAGLSTVDDHLVGLALDLFRACVTPGPRPEARQRVRELIDRGVPLFEELPESDWGGKKDEEYAFSILRKIRRHLAGTRSRIASVDLLGEFCEQLSPIYFRPWWYEFGY